MIDQLIQGASSRTVLIAIYQVLTELVSSPTFSKHTPKSIVAPEGREVALLAASILRAVRPRALSEVEVRAVVASLSETLERHLKQAGVYEPSVGAPLLAALRTKYEATALGISPTPAEGVEAGEKGRLWNKYADAIHASKGKLDGSVQERDGKLHFAGTVRVDKDRTQIWNALKTIPDWSADIVADIKVADGSKRAEAPAKTYTVKAGDTLSRIAKEHLGDANAYNKILEVNQDQLRDRTKIKPGQVLKLPS
ncbi:MAG TPA: LysM peptidoglycan-binding domain-containing protein [Vicinamibacterales bacterium]|nr:LysM peptidoglycan-binding domain-containing protein [Vicinamibacterales bacterium]